MSENEDTSNIVPATEEEIQKLAVPEETPAVVLDEPILIEESSDDGMSKIRQSGRMQHGMKDSDFKRSLNVNGNGATRCRLFHARIAEDALDSMQRRINEWIDSDQIEVKHVTQSIAPLEGKIPKPNVIITVWY